MPSPPLARKATQGGSELAISFHLLDANFKAEYPLRSLVEKLEVGLDFEALAILHQHMNTQLEEKEWKFQTT